MTARSGGAFNKDKTRIRPAQYLKDAMLAARQICKARFEAFGTAARQASSRPFRSTPWRTATPGARSGLSSTEKRLAGIQMTQVRQSPVARARRF